MTSDEAEQRIQLSRRTLTRYSAMAAAGEWPSADNFPHIQEEIRILEEIGEEHPGKVTKLVRLVSEWVAFRDSMRSKLH